MVSAIQSGGSYSYRFKGKLSQEVTVNQSVKQGCCLSPSLFNMFGKIHFERNFVSKDEYLS